MTFKDLYKHQGQRNKLVDLIERKGISDPKLLRVLREVPRHYFVSSVFQDQAYEDRPLSIEDGQTISQPYTVAYQTELLEIERRMKVLEIGTGSGYQYYILYKLGARVYSIERSKKLYEKTKKLLSQLIGYPPDIFLGDGSLGLPSMAPFDRIIVTAAAPSVPEALVEQLAPGGILVIPVGDKDTQAMLRLRKDEDGKLSEERFALFKFVPLIGDQGWEKKK